MSKPVSGSFINILQTPTGTEPVFMLALSFGAGPNWFATKSVYGMRPAIVGLGVCSCEARADSSGTTGTVSVQLSDYDGFAGLMHNIQRMEKGGASLFMAFEDQPQEAAICLIAGQVAGPVEWDEASRVLSFTIETAIESDDAGFAAIDEFDDLAPEARNVAWPMIFGSPAHVPALRVRKQTEGRLMTPIRLKSGLYKFNQGARVAVMDEDCKVVSYFDAEETHQTIYVENGDQFPQDQDVEIEIDRVCFKGSFSGTIFTVTAANTPYYVDVDMVPTAFPPDSDLYALRFAATGPDFDGNLTGMHAYFRSPPGRRIYNYVEKQEGGVVTFKYSMEDLGIQNTSPLQFKAIQEGKIERAYAVLPNGIDNAYASTHEAILNVEKYNLEPWALVGGVYQVKPDQKLSGIMDLMTDVIGDASRVMWMRPGGTRVKLRSADPEIYVASCVPLEEITAVVGKKTVQLPDGGSIKVFEPIPTSYYTIQLQSNYLVGGEASASALLFAEPLKARREEGWDDDVYVTARSSVGPNPGAIIRYLLKTYVPGIVIGDFDQDSLDDANFALFQKRNALDLCREIAWQARCALRLDGPVADLVYLDQGNAATITFDETNVRAGSVKTGNTDVNAIKTKLILRWRPDYRHIPMPNVETTISPKLVQIIGQLTKDVDTKENFYVYRENIDVYGEKTDTRECYIFNNVESVGRTAKYWGHIYANSWKTIRFEGFVLGCFVQAFDTLGVAFSGFGLAGYNGLRGEVKYQGFNPAEKTTSITLRLEAIAGG